MLRLISVFFRERRRNCPIWLLGENLGNTASNNSYYLWRHVVSRHTDKVSPYLILERTPENQSRFREFSKEERDWIIWRHSPSHAWLYLKAEFSFVTLSFRDVWPECVRLWGLTKSFQPIKRCSLVYLQHGTLGIKALGYGPTYAGGTMLRFLHYNPHIGQKLIEVNKFRPYQLHYAVYHPRYQELVRRARQAGKKSGRQVLWFLTWREYMGKNITTYKFFFRMARLLRSAELRKWLERTDASLTICLHQLTDTKCMEYLPLLRAACADRMKIVFASQIDVMDEIVSSDLLITDYSSLGFDFTFLKKPVVLYAPDLETYHRGRPFYCSREEFSTAAVFSDEDLMRALEASSSGEVNPFFASRMEMPDEGIYDQILAGDFIERIFQYYHDLQRNTYAFLGYDFSGVGGTVSATKALAEGLLEAGKRVVLAPLKNGGKGEYAPGVVNRPLVDWNDHSKIARFKRKFLGSERDYSYLKYDKDMPNLRPYCGKALTALMRSIRAKAVISTRETLHFFLHDAASPHIREKFYYYHCHADFLDAVFPGTIDRLKTRQIENALFVTRQNKVLLQERYGYHHYDRSVITGNALESTRMIGASSIAAVPWKSQYRLMYLLRLSKDRWPDVERALQFIRYLKLIGERRIHIDFYGKGDQVLRLQKLLVEEDLDGLACYRGETRDLVTAYAQHDAMVDFSRFQSFGMGYIEAVFNGRIPFCRHNEGSDEVLSGLPWCFYETDEELRLKVLALPTIRKEELLANYDRIAERYSRQAVARTLLGAE